ncbi:leucine-rich repeat domain-containing protein [Treponema sp. C6A8]|uniref:leucine-rich repeat domain-containing protein n=1 Tax=Treponema sp. C6A8 TaxID=1410609 RepID=UPI00048A0C9B|nr:leucine-rich repeat domain-containing protein [Treponema sp. C6A8]
MSDYTSKNGLLFTSDMNVLVGIDSASSEFNGQVPYGPKEIADEAFAGTNVSSITLPDSVKELPDCLFENIESLQSVKLPPSLQVLPPYLFSGCSNLTKVSMPNVVTEFPEGLFYNCASLPDIPFRAGIQELPENCCAGCSSIRSVVVPNTVAKIHSRAFADCKGLETVVLPAKLYELADDAFEGCDSIRNIRVDEGNNLFYIKDDGCLYEKSLDGDDKLRIKISPAQKNTIEFYEDSLSEDSEIVLADTDDLEDDDIFSSEIGAADEEVEAAGEELEKDSEEIGATDAELTAMGAEEVPEENLAENVDNIVENDAEITEENKMSDNVDDMLADIMGEEKARVDSVSGVGIEAEEAKEEGAPSSAAISTDELANLFSSGGEEAGAGRDDVHFQPKDRLALDSKTKILIESVGFSKIELCEPTGEPPEDGDLFVIAEKIITSDIGEHSFSEKLMTCVKKIARIHDFKRIILLYALPSDNEEFQQFYFHFINKRNVIFACEAASPASLSDYGKMICEQSRISLDSNELAEQRKRVSIKSDMLIKLVIQDKYE